jgi:hypothetical protein
MNEPSHFERLKSETEALYKSSNSVFCPYFGTEIIFNAEGLYHLQYSSRTERTKAEQSLKYILFKYVSQIIKKSGTIQEYRKTMGIVGKTKGNGEKEMKIIEYWGLVAIVGEKRKQRIKVILRKVGTGPVIFWSVMPDLKKSITTYGLASDDTEEG